jgi:holdfast attachment protein HfaA
MIETVSKFRRASRLAIPLVAGWLMLASGAQAQTINSNSASFNAGYGRTAGQENSPVNVQMTDINGNLTVVNGEITGVAAGSIFAGAGASASASGAVDSFAGAGASGASASAIGNNLTVVTQGNNNVVIVNSVQSNTGDVTATTNVNGKP